MDSTVYRAYGKINLSLDVTGVREDGYHLVRMIMQTVDVYDVLSFTRIPADEVRVTVAPESAERGAMSLPTGNANLVCRAIDAMRGAFGIREGIRVMLTKNIPMAAGMAGGSVDAAAAFRAMNELFDLGVSDAQLAELALPLGADIPYCLTGGTQLAEGIGGDLTPLCAMPECGIVLLKPAEGVATGAVYRALDAAPIEHHPDISGMLDAIRRADLKGVCERCGNVLERVTAGMLPAIGEIKKALCAQGAMTSCMTGSGPTVFGIFEDRCRAEEAAKTLAVSGLCADGRLIATAPADTALKKIG